MAIYQTSERFNKIKKKVVGNSYIAGNEAGEEKKSSQENKYHTSTRFRNVKQAVYQRGLSSGANRIKQFANNVQGFATTAQKDSSTLGYGNAAELSTNYSQSGSKLRNEADSLLEYLYWGKDYMSEDAYNDTVAFIKQARDHVGSVVGYYNNQADIVAGFETEEDYNAALQDYNYRQKYGGKSYTEINEALATIADGAEKDWLTAYAPTVMTAEDYDRKIAEVNKSLEIKEADLNRYEDAIKNLAAGSAVREMIINEINEKYGSRTGLEEQIEQLKADRYTYENEKKYNLLSENADFEEQSKVMATEQTSNLLDSLFGTAQHHYDYINGFLKTDLDRTERYKFSPNAEPGEDAKYLSNSIVDMFAGYLSFMSDTEKDRYNYLYNTQGAESAEEYLKYLENTLSSRAMSYTQEEWEALTTQLPLQSSMVSVPLNLWSGIGYVDVLGQKLVKDIQEDVTGEYAGPINYNSAAMLPAVTSSTIRGTTAQNLADEYGVINFNEEEHPILSTLLNGKSWGDVYQLGMSMVDSAAVAVTSPVLGTAGTLMLSGSAATRFVLDAVANGATDEQALWMGAMSGAFEYLFEKYELESLLKNGSENAIRAFVSQGLSEGFGEGATTIANRVADSLIMADKSQLNRSIAAYMEANPGMTREKALQKALTDMAVQVGWDTVGGMASGSIMGSGASVIKNAANAINRNGETGDQIKDVYGSDVLSLISETLEIDPNNTLAQRLQTKLNNSKDISSSEIQSLVRANQAAIQKQDISTIQKAAQGRLAELGETGDITAISSVLAKQAAGQNLTRQERQAVSNSRYGSRVANELDPDNIRSGEYSTAWAQQIGTDRINAEAYNSVQEDTLTDRQVLEWAVKSVDFKTMKPQVREALKSFQSHLQQVDTIQALLQKEQGKLQQAGSAYEQQKAQSNINRLNQILSRQEKRLQTLEKTPALKQLLEKARSEASKTTIPNTENRRKETVANSRTYDRISAASDIITDGSHIENGKLKPNVTYQTGEHAYIYTTDADGLISSVHVDELQEKSHEGRLEYARNTYGKQAGDHAGHLIGDRFGGSPELDNLVSQAALVNLSKYKKIENQWANALKAGKKISVDITVNYDGGVRPVSFSVEYTINGKKYQSDIPNN